MITRETDYAIRTVLCLSLAYAESRPVPVSEVAERMDVPYRFLRLLSRKLISGGLVTSKRGNNGGLVLTREPKAISLLDVMRVMDSKAGILNRCLVPSEAPCSRAANCQAHQPLGRLQHKLDDILGSLTFDTLV